MTRDKVLVGNIHGHSSCKNIVAEYARVLGVTARIPPPLRDPIMYAARFGRYFVCVLLLQPYLKSLELRHRNIDYLLQLYQQCHNNRSTHVLQTTALLSMLIDMGALIPRHYKSTTKYVLAAVEKHTVAADREAHEKLLVQESTAGMLQFVPHICMHTLQY